MARQRQHIGPAIRTMRTEKDMTLDYLAAQAGVSASHLSRIETCQTLPSFVVLGGIAEALGVSLDHFTQLEREIAAFQKQTRPYLISRGIGRAAINSFFTMPYPHQREFMRLIRGEVGRRNDHSTEARRETAATS